MSPTRAFGMDRYMRKIPDPKRHPHIRCYHDMGYALTKNTDVDAERRIYICILALISPRNSECER